VSIADPVTLKMCALILFGTRIAVKRVCIVHADLSHVPTSKFSRRRNSLGLDYFVVSFSLRMSIVKEVGP
jgi:hypothetical protein